MAATRAINFVVEQLRYQTATGDLRRKGYYVSVVQKLGVTAGASQQTIAPGMRHSF